MNRGERLQPTRGSHVVRRRAAIVISSLTIVGAVQAASAAVPVASASVPASSHAYSVGSVADAEALDARPDADGGLLVLSAINRLGQTSIVLSRLETNGRLDPSFGRGNATIGSLAAELPQTARVVTLTSGGSFAVWQTQAPVGSGGAELHAVRVLMDGQIDPHWGRAGRLTIPLHDTSLAESAVDPTGRLVLGGVSASHAVVLRVTASGRVDHAFAGGMWVDPTSGTAVTSLSVDFRSRPVVAETEIVTTTSESDGTPERAMAAKVTRLGKTGAPDPTFGVGGAVALGLPQPPAGEIAPKASIGPRNRILVAYSDTAGAHFSRLTPRGALDDDFGAGGTVLVRAVSACLATAFDDLAATNDDGALAIVHQVSTCPVLVEDEAQRDRAASCGINPCRTATIAVNGHGAPLEDPARNLSAPDYVGGVRVESTVPLADGGVISVGSRVVPTGGAGGQVGLEARVEEVDADASHRASLGGRGEVDLELGGVPDDSVAGVAVLGGDRAMIVGSAFTADGQSLTVAPIDRSGRELAPPEVLRAIRPEQGHDLEIQSATAVGKRVVVGVLERCSTAAVQPAHCPASHEKSILVGLTAAGRLDERFGRRGQVDLPGGGDQRLDVIATRHGLMALRTSEEGSSEVVLLSSRSGRLVRDFGSGGAVELGRCDSLTPAASWLPRAERLVVALNCDGSRSTVVSFDATGHHVVRRDLASGNLDTRVTPGGRPGDAAFATLDGGLVLIDSQARLRALAPAGTLQRVVLDQGGFASGLAWSRGHLLVAGTSESDYNEYRAVVGTLAVTGTTARVLGTTAGPANSQPIGGPAVSESGRWLLGGTEYVPSLPTPPGQPAAFLAMAGR
ncbi:MAG TPA: hypothetical protein VIJ51_11195 [Solirubrobacteraceae bacterium]